MWVHGQTVAQKRKHSLNTHFLSVLYGRLGKAVPILSGGFCTVGQRLCLFSSQHHHVNTIVLEREAGLDLPLGLRDHK